MNRYHLFQVAFALCALAVHSACPSKAAEPTVAYELKHAAGPLDNPLKGLVPYARPYPDRFPHSMEFMYLALEDLMLAEDRFQWQPLEDLLDDIASRGNQAVIRIYVEYPGKKKGVPKYLVDQGLKIHTYINTNTAPLPPTEVSTPDYEDPRLRKAFQTFISAFGKKYDGDPRLAYITAGLLGTWGEWHTYPRNDLWASDATQKIVLDAYESAFSLTPILLRYPAGPGHGYQSENASRPFGYHDDSFAWATLDTGKRQDDWFYIPALKAAGDAAVNKWKTSPIGGEIRPEVWGKIFDAPDQWPAQSQSIHDCITETHVTWLMDTGMFREVASSERKERAAAEVRRMGYELHVRGADFSVDPASGQCRVTLQLINQGVAPFYADWPTEIAFADPSGTLAKQSVAAGLSMQGHLPRLTPHKLTESVDITGLAGTYSVLLRVVNPLVGGKQLRFANIEQDQTSAGWLTLGKIDI
ncbi:MAG: DUF4832 domain-containing protein [Planctomycetales bacterium]|nr:DUF4832 domain-containing protein [Planctomycetales bacterium]